MAVAGTLGLQEPYATKNSIHGDGTVVHLKHAELGQETCTSLPGTRLELAREPFERNLFAGALARLLAADGDFEQALAVIR